MTLGRPSDYTAETAAEICERIAEGQSLRRICLDDAMPGLRTVLAWLIKHQDFQLQYARARETQADVLADEINDIADDGSRDYGVDANGNRIVDHDHIARARLRVDTRKWVASKLKPRKYGDKLELGHDPNAAPQVMRVEFVEAKDDE